MNNDDGMAKRRARLQALRGRYEQPAHGIAPAMSATPMTDPVAPTQGGRRRKGGRVDRRGQAEAESRGQRQGGGLLQRLAQFLTETPPGDTLLPGMPVGEQRLQQAIHLLEQRARTAQGSAGERIQRLLKFLKQDIPGEPMVGGVNLWRLQQTLERAGQSPGSDRATLTTSLVPSSVKNEEQPVERVGENVSPSREAVRSKEHEADSEITAIEADLQRLRAATQDLQTRLEQARQRVGSSGAEPSQEIKQPVVRPPESNTAPRSSGDDWFLEFLE